MQTLDEVGNRIQLFFGQAFGNIFHNRVFALSGCVAAGPAVWAGTDASSAAARAKAERRAGRFMAARKGGIKTEGGWISGIKPASSPGGMGAGSYLFHSKTRL